MAKSPGTAERNPARTLGREARITAITLLKCFYDEDIFARLVKEMYDADPLVSEAAIQASASLGNEVAVPHLYRIIEHGQRSQRLAAVKALAAIHAPSSTGMLVKYFNHFPETDLRTEILAAINLIAPTSQQVTELDRAVLIDPRQSEEAKRVAAEALVEGERDELLKDLLPRASPLVLEAVFAKMLQGAAGEPPEVNLERLAPGPLGAWLCLLAVRGKAPQQNWILEQLQRAPRRTLHTFLSRLAGFQGRLRYPTRIFRLLMVLPYVDPDVEGVLGDFLRRIVAEVKTTSPHLLSEFAVITSAHLDTVFSKARKNFLSLRGIARRDELMAMVLGGLVERFATPAILSDLQTFFRDESGSHASPVAKLRPLVGAGTREEQNRFEACLPLFAMTERKDRLTVSAALARVDLARPANLRRLNRLVRIAGVLEIKTASHRIQEILEFARAERVPFLEESAIGTLCQLLTRSIIEQSRDIFKQPERAPSSLLGYVRGARWIPPRIMIGPLIHLVLQPRTAPAARALAVESLQAMDLREVAHGLPPLLKALDLAEIPEPLRLAIADLLGRAGDGALAHQALDLSSARSAVTRRAAVRVLRGLATRDVGAAGEVLTNRMYLLLDDPEPPVRMEALLTLIALDDDYATQVVTDHSASGDAGFIAELLHSIGRPLTREGFALVRSLLRMDSAPVQAELRGLASELCQGTFAEETRQVLLEALAGTQVQAPAPAAAEPEAPTGAQSTLAHAKLEFKLRRENTQVLTVFFCDIVGYTEKTAAMDTSALLGLIRTFEGLLGSAITANRGLVVKKYGDGILAVFRHPVNAVISAMTVQQKIRQHNEMHVAAEKFLVRIGLNTGPVLRKDNDVFGEVVNVASRMQSAAQPGEIMLTGSTFGEVRDFVRCTELGRIQVKGIRDPITAYSPEEVLVDLAELAGGAPGADRGQGRSSTLERLRESMFVPEFRPPASASGRAGVAELAQVFAEIVQAVEDIARDYQQEYEFKRWMQERWDEITRRL